MRQAGLVRGGSLENAIVLARDGALNPDGLRFVDEFCRHKALDLIGDFALHLWQATWWRIAAAMPCTMLWFPACSRIEAPGGWWMPRN